MNQKEIILYVHGKGGNIQEAEHYKQLFPDCEVVALDYQSDTPWETKDEFRREYDRLTSGFEKVILIANSIGAYFSMNALSDYKIEQAYFISPMVNMEKLIFDMMGWAGVSEKELQEKGDIQTTFGETLSWKYLQYVRRNPIRWEIPTRILYAIGDHLISLDTMKDFAENHRAELCVMEENGEHWFHTEEQMAFLDAWILSNKESGQQLVACHREQMKVN